LAKNNKDLFIKLSAPEKKSFFTNEQLDWLDILIHAREQEIENHYNKYSLIPASDRTEPWTLDHFKQLYEDDMQSGENFLQKKKNLESKYTIDKELIVAKHNVPKEAREIGSLVAEIGHYRFLTSFYGRWLGYYLVLICRRFAPELDLTFEELSSCNEKELITYLETGKGVSKRELTNRALAQTIVMENGEVKIFFGRQAIKQRQNKLAEIDYSKLKTIKGEIANLGKVQGKAYVFYWNDDISKKIQDMPKDSILVAPQTHPIYMPAISRAKALVTDEGGVTGHAAIVSRELDKPCVIGLHIITKVVKTGDIIEVDADNGMVKIIKRKS
jgi:phosphoenolpyruvate synthase/pyruvate phosphate dikinase